MLSILVHRTIEFMAIPDRVGRYRIERRLGSGAFATVWLASDDVLESQVAIKVLAENWARHADVRAQFEQEARILRRADSDRLVRIHDFGERGARRRSAFRPATRRD
jgi:serine/threonine protein kinase